MDPRSRIYKAIIFPTCIDKSTLPPDDDFDFETTPPPWQQSQLNPANRVDSLAESYNSLPPSLQPSHSHSCAWSIDGGDKDGNRLFAVPSFARSRPPQRIDVFLPPNAGPSASQALQFTLQPGATMMVSGRLVGSLDFSRHLLNALRAWSTVGYPGDGFECAYFEMPFGSHVVIENVRADPKEMAVEIHLVPSFRVERQWLSAQTLREFWGLPESRWPPVVGWEELGFERQLTEAVSLVRMRGRHGDEMLVFKSADFHVKAMYHELKLLLMMDQHPNVMAKPLYIVTKKARFGGREGVCGFVMPYFPLGTLQDVLTRSGSRDLYDLSLRLQWARQIVSAFQHIQETPAGFYSDVKLDNILMAFDGERPFAILTDFEQSCGWHAWSPPEVFYVEYIVRVARSKIDPSIRNDYTSLMRKYVPGWKPLRQSSKYDNPAQAYSTAWLVLNVRERESAMVYMLGKIIWCIFEGVGQMHTQPTMKMFRSREYDQIFPEFRYSPMTIQECIRKCTAGAPEWQGKLSSVVRRGSRLYPRGRSGANGEPLGTARETRETACTWWQETLQDAKAFVESRVRHRDNPSGQTDNCILNMAKKRPRMRELADTLRSLQLEGWKTRRSCMKNSGEMARNEKNLLNSGYDGEWSQQDKRMVSIA